MKPGRKQEENGRVKCLGSPWRGGLGRDIALQPEVGKAMVRRFLTSGDKEGDEEMDSGGKALKASPGQCQ